MITVSSSQLSSVAYLNRLRKEKNKFTRPHFKCRTPIDAEDDYTVRLMAEDFEAKHGKATGEIIAKIKSENKGWNKVVESLQRAVDHSQAKFEASTDDKPKIDDREERQARKGFSKEDLEALKMKAREAEQSLKIRNTAAIRIQALVRKKLAIKLIGRMRLEKQSAGKIKRFLRKLANDRKKMDTGLRKFKNHFYASIIQRFMRECTQNIAKERDRERKEDLIRALFDGIKTRKILDLPRLKEVKHEITTLQDRLDEPELDLAIKRQLNDDIKYQKNLFLNLFNKFWNKKVSIADELQREKDKERRKRGAGGVPGSPHSRKDQPNSRRRSPSNNDIVRSRLSSRNPSIDHSVDDSKFNNSSLNRLHPDDRPIKPMKSGMSGGLGASEQDFGKLGMGGGSRQRKDRGKQEATAHVSDKVLKQRELMDKRRKYDPRKALQNSEADDKNTTKKISKEEKPIKNDPKKKLDNIPEHHSEDKSGFFIGDELGAFGSTDNSKPKKDFLKRKSKKVEFIKVDWSNVQRRIDCWVPKENIPEKKEHSRALIPKLSPRAQRRGASPQPSRDLNMIKLKGEDIRKKDQARRAKTQKKDSDIMKQIEDTLESSYIPKLNEIFNKEIIKNDSSKIPVLKTTSKFNLYIEENDLKDVLEELEGEYDILVNL